MLGIGKKTFPQNTIFSSWGRKSTCVPLESLKAEANIGKLNHFIILKVYTRGHIVPKEKFQIVSDPMTKVFGRLMRKKAW